MMKPLFDDDNSITDGWFNVYQFKSGVQSNFTHGVSITHFPSRQIALDIMRDYMKNTDILHKGYAIRVVTK